MEDNQNCSGGILKLIEELERDEKLKNLSHSELLIKWYEDHQRIRALEKNFDSQISTMINLIESSVKLQDEIKFLQTRVLYLEGLVLEKREKE